MNERAPSPTAMSSSGNVIERHDPGVKVEQMTKPTAWMRTLRALLVDPIHVDRSASTVAQIAAVPPSLLPYAQF